MFGCVAAVGAWAGGSVLRAWSLTPRLAAYGKLSYSLYAFHFAVLDVVLVLVVAAFPTGSSAQLMAAVTFPVVLVATWPVAFLMHRYVETPVSRLLRGPARAAP